MTARLWTEGAPPPIRARPHSAGDLIRPRICRRGARRQPTPAGDPQPPDFKL